MKEEVLRYLGHKGQEIDESLMSTIDNCIKEIKEISNIRSIYEVFNISQARDSVEVLNTNLVLTGKAINEHLSKSDKCALMAITIGHEVERKINIYKKIDLTKAIVLDACATAYVEEACDEIEKEIGKIAGSENKNITWRFSPGYGDLPLDIQKDFLETLKASKKIGVTASSHNILFPRKSVTAIIGFVDKSIKLKNRSCLNCNNYETCMFRKDGSSCGS